MSATSPTRHRVLLLPGSVLPADLAYGALIEAIGERADARAKELEVYATETPPPDYTLDTEIAGIERASERLGWDRFHLVGYSGGGAASVAFAAARPEWLLSLSLLEPAWAGNWDLSPQEARLWEEYDRLLTLPPDEFMEAFVRLGLRAGVAPPSRTEGPPPPWMAKRPAGIRAFLTTFTAYPLDREALTRFTPPVYFALGALSNPDEYGAIATRLADVFPDFRLEVFEGRHHFDPPHRIEPERLAASLLRTWDDGDAQARAIT
jgi:pimeloyl-ACP methyl ester carboxylesterase